MDDVYKQQAEAAAQRAYGQIRTSYVDTTPSDYVGSTTGSVFATCNDLQAIMDRLDGCIDAASKSAERVSIVADRVKGATPEVGANGTGLASVGLGSIAEIHSRLDRLSNALHAISDNIARIERL